MRRGATCRNATVRALPATTASCDCERQAYGAGIDEPIVWYEGSGTTDRRWFHADERGSIIAVSNGSGAVTNINSYDEYGVPAATNAGRFGYTGQAWLPELGMYYYKARIYNPAIGRFMQTDPIGYVGGMNLYGYVTGDPINFIDPLGLDALCGAGRRAFYPKRPPQNQPSGDDGGITVTAQYFCVSEEPGSLGGGQGGGQGERPGSSPGGVGLAPQRGCSAAKSAQLAQLNGIASKLGPVAFDSASELSLLAQYFWGDTTPYRLSGAEMAQARAYVGPYGDSVLGSTVRAGAGGTTERSIFFGKFASDAPLLDGLLGTATGIFRRGSLVGIRDTFNFDFKDRGGYPYGTFANAGVAVIRADAATCAGNISISVTGGRS